MADQKDNYIADHASAWRDGSFPGPSRPADEADESVLASIAYRHASRYSLREADWPADATPAAPEAEQQPVVSEVEQPEAPKAEPPEAGLTCPCEASDGEVFYVRQAMRKSRYQPTRGEVARDRLARGKLARVLIVYLLAVTALTGLAVGMYFLTQ